MENQNKSHSDYCLVCSKIEYLLNNRMDGLSALAPIREVCYQYDFIKPAIQFTSGGQKHAYEVLIDFPILPAVKLKWVELNAKGYWIYFVVPEQYQKQVQIECLRLAIKNYYVIKFKFADTHSGNRDVELT
jgi:hypothetical protein